MPATVYPSLGKPNHEWVTDESSMMLLSVGESPSCGRANPRVVIVAKGTKNNTVQIARAEVSVCNIRLARCPEAVNVY